MVNAPEYLTMDDARERAIPELFEDLIEPDGVYMIEVMEPRVDGRDQDGPTVRPYYVISARSDGEVVCSMYPNGTWELNDPEFQSHLERLLEAIDKVAIEARDRDPLNRVLLRRSGDLP